MTSAPLSPELRAKFTTAKSQLDAGRHLDAETLLQEILAQAPDNVAVLGALGMAALARDDLAEAERMHRRTIALSPDRPEPIANTADIVLRGDNPTAAAPLIETLLQRFGEWPGAHYLNGRLKWEQHLAKEAFLAFGRAIASQPDLALPVELWSFSKILKCDWRGREEMEDFYRGRVRAGAIACQPLVLMHLWGSPADLAQCARAYTTEYFPPSPPLWRERHRRTGRIRLGYLSSDLGDHPVGNLIAGVLEHHDRERFELTAFSFSRDKKSATAQRIRKCFDHFLDVEAMDSAAIARLVALREIDVAISLNGYTQNQRPEVMALRPAPVQVNFQGFPGTMGAPYIDYLVADRTVIRPGEEQHYNEKLAFMPATYQPTDDKAVVAEATPTRADEGLPEGAFVFMPYNKSISPPTFQAWMRILRRVEGAVLWLYNGGPEAQANLRREAEAAGIDPLRLIFARFAEARADHLARHRLADLFLDTLPYNAHSTASDALWVGLPVITCRGTAFPGRVCAGLLNAAGLPELITEDIAAYEELAVALATDAPRLAALRRKVETTARQSALFDTAAYTRALEQAFAVMHERRMAGLAPVSFEVGA